MTEHKAGALDEILRAYGSDPDFVAEGVALEVVEQALTLMKEKGMTRAALAQAMGVAPAFISKLLNAPPNLTLRTIARLGLALGAKPVVQLVTMNEQASAATTWSLPSTLPLAAAHLGPSVEVSATVFVPMDIQRSCHYLGLRPRPVGLAYGLGGGWVAFGDVALSVPSFVTKRPNTIDPLATPSSESSSETRHLALASA